MSRVVFFGGKLFFLVGSLEKLTAFEPKNGGLEDAASFQLGEFCWFYISFWGCRQMSSCHRHISASQIEQRSMCLKVD